MRRCSGVDVCFNKVKVPLTRGNIKNKVISLIEIKVHEVAILSIKIKHYVNEEQEVDAYVEIFRCDMECKVFDFMI
ncbi:MAG: hypothetical protein J7J99_05230 [Thermoprotei archaeon]|nr:hypothetical protein [Thermoprotei archaeon]